MTSPVDFVHINVHSDYSLKNSIAPIKRIVQKVASLNQKAVSLVDEGNLFGVVEFVKACKEASIQPIIGSKLWVPGDKTYPKASQNSLLLLCKNKEGFSNLKQLSSIGYLEGFYYVPRVDMSDIIAHSEGLICIIPQYDSDIGKLLEMGQANKAKEKIKELKDIFGENLFLELQNHGLSMEYKINKELDAIGESLGIMRVAGNDCYYVDKEDALAHEIFLQKEKRTFREFPNGEFYIKSYDEMQVFLKDFPHALDATVHIADMCNFNLDFPGPQLPDFPIPQQFKDEKIYLHHLVFEGLKKRYKSVTEELTARAEYELDVIGNMGFSGYFLIVWDIIDFAHKNNIPVGPGRGSAPGSIVAYALGITGLDPLKYNLLFERFLHSERISMPDIDTDFCVDRRQDIIDYTRKRYGEDHVGQIITFSSLKPRGAIRDVARALGFSVEEAGEIAKLIPFNSKGLEEAKKLEPRLEKFTSEKHKQLFQITSQLLGTHRHASLHAAGIVIGKKPLIEYTPLYKDPKSGGVATQYTMDYLEESGLVKMDILGLRTVTIIDNVEKKLRETIPDFSIEDIPENDEKTFKMLSAGDSDGVFQFESPGMKLALKKVKPNRVIDLIALNALFRPGPMEHIDTYADVKHGIKSPEYHLDVLESILQETYGVIVYQEQVMQIAREVAGYSLAEADLLRRAMGKKKKEEMQEQLNRFVQGATEKGFKKEIAENIFKLLEPFAGYGFNKSHAVAYGLLAYRTAYLKCNYPQIFFVAQLNAIASNLEDVAKYINVCKNMKIKILPPDINKSEYKFKIENNAIRYGFNAIKTIDDETKNQITQERKQNGKYTSVLNVIERLGNTRNMMSFLKAGIASGMFDSLDSRRAVLFANMEYIANEGKARHDAHKDNMSLLFETEEDKTLELNDVNIKKDDSENVYFLEREYLGTYLTYHPISSVKDIWQKETTLNLAMLDWFTPQRIARQKRGPYRHSRENHYLVCYVDSVKERIRETHNIYSGVASDLRGNIRFVYRVDKKDNIKNIEKTVCTLVGQLEFREQENEYTFWVSSVIQELDKVHQIRANDSYAAPALKAISNLRLHIQLNSQCDDILLKTMKEKMLNNYGDTRVVLHMPLQKNMPTAIDLPPGFTVDVKNEKFLKELSEYSCVESIWCK